MSDCKTDTCGTGCHCEDEFAENNKIDLELEDGTIVECEILSTLEIDGKEYIALLPMGKDEYYIYGYKEYDDGFEIINVENDVEFDKVAEAFDELFASEDDEDDEEFDDEEFEGDDAEEVKEEEKK